MRIQLFLRSAIRSATVGTALIIGSSSIMIASPAWASGPTPSPHHASPRGCQTNDYYSYDGITETHIQKYSTNGGPGVTLQIAITVGDTVTGTVGGQVSGDINAIIAGAQAQVNSSLAHSKASGINITGTWTVPSNAAEGWFYEGASSDKMNWEYGHLNTNCQYIKDRSGSANLPYYVPSFWHTQR